VTAAGTQTRLDCCCWMLLQSPSSGLVGVARCVLCEVQDDQQHCFRQRPKPPCCLLPGTAAGVHWSPAHA